MANQGACSIAHLWAPWAVLLQQQIAPPAPSGALPLPPSCPVHTVPRCSSVDWLNIAFPPISYACGPHTLCAFAAAFCLLATSSTVFFIWVTYLHAATALSILRAARSRAETAGATITQSRDSPSGGGGRTVALLRSCSCSSIRMSCPRQSTPHTTHKARLLPFSENLSPDTQAQLHDRTGIVTATQQALIAVTVERCMA